MSQPYDPSGQQQSPWGGPSTPQQPPAGGYGGQPQHPGYGGAAQPPSYGQPQQGQPQPGHGAPQTQQLGQQHGGQQHGQQQIPGYGPPGDPNGWSAGAQPAPAEPGPLARLFDLRLTKLFSPDHLRGAMALVLVVAVAVTVNNVVQALPYFDYATGATVFSGVVAILLAPVWGLAVMLVGRFAIELLIHLGAVRAATEKAAERATAGSEEGE